MKQILAFVIIIAALVASVYLILFIFSPKRRIWKKPLFVMIIFMIIWIPITAWFWWDGISHMYSWYLKATSCALGNKVDNIWKTIWEYAICKADPKIGAAWFLLYLVWVYMVYSSVYGWRKWIISGTRLFLLNQVTLEDEGKEGKSE